MQVFCHQCKVGHHCIWLYVRIWIYLTFMLFHFEAKTLLTNSDWQTKHSRSKVSNHWAFFFLCRLLSLRLCSSTLWAIGSSHSLANNDVCFAHCVEERWSVFSFGTGACFAVAVSGCSSEIQGGEWPGAICQNLDIRSSCVFMRMLTIFPFMLLRCWPYDSRWKHSGSTANNK